MNEQEENKDYDSGFFDGKDFARRSTPRVPTRQELEYMTEAYVKEKSDNPYEAGAEEFEEAWLELNSAYIGVFEKYKDDTGMIHKIALVCYASGERDFDCFAWTIGGCYMVESRRKEGSK